MYVAANPSRMCVPVSVAGLCTDGCIVVYCEKLLVLFHRGITLFELIRKLQPTFKSVGTECFLLKRLILGLNITFF